MDTESTAFLVKEFLRNFFTTYVILLIIPIVIEGGIDGYIWAFVLKSIPFLLISFLNSLVLFILDLSAKNNARLSFLPALIFFGYLIFVFQKIDNYGAIIFTLGILIAILISNFLRFRKINLK
jgi:hypothetical protein